MKARIVPLYFGPDRDSEFSHILTALQSLLAEQVQFLEPQPLGSVLPEAEAVLFPQLLGQAYRRVEDFRAITIPILLVTTEFGTLSMWDWEIAEYLRSHGIQTIGPYYPEQTKKVCNALAVKRELKETKFLVYQDEPGEGFQASIFKRFYWWEEECTQRLREKFGVTIVRQSFRELGQRAKAISDIVADEALAWWDIPTEGLGMNELRRALKLYLAVSQDLNADRNIRAVGINCLNESHFSDTTPCLAWNLLYQERKIIWGCEADTMTMVSMYLLHNSLKVPMFMTNVYPFLLGGAALKHERIAAFPEVDSEPENHVLVAHCGYMGVIPQPFASEWTLRKKVLAIVNDGAVAIDARIPVGKITLAKLHPSIDKMTVAEGELIRYVQFPGSDCLNGGVIRIKNGYRLMDALVSHHYLVLGGHHAVDIRFLGKVFDLKVEEV
jgi:hypothetical protein